MQNLDTAANMSGVSSSFDQLMRRYFNEMSMCLGSFQCLVLISCARASEIARVADSAHPPPQQPPSPCNQQHQPGRLTIHFYEGACHALYAYVSPLPAIVSVRMYLCERAHLRHLRKPRRDI